jgi:DNA-binding CsgD family transcriptional regulator
MQGLIELAYETAVDGGLWPSLLASLARHLHVPKLGLYVRHSHGRLEVLETVGYERRWVEDFLAYHAKTSPYHNALKGYPIGRAAVLPGPPLSSALYNDWMRPQEIQHVLGGIVSRVQGQYVALTGLRGGREGTFRAAEIRAHSAIIAHLGWAFHLRNRLLRAGWQPAGGWAAWDASPQAVIFLDRHGRVAYVNPAALWVLTFGGALSLRGDRLAAWHPRSIQALGGLVHRAIRRGEGVARAGGSLQLPSPSGRAGLTAQVYPLNAAREWIGLGGAPLAAAVFLNASTPPAPNSPSGLRDRFGLTPAEIRLAQCLTRGLSVRQAAETLGASYHTVRAHLRAVYDKTGVNRQNALMRILLPFANDNGPA